MACVATSILKYSYIYVLILDLDLVFGSVMLYPTVTLNVTVICVLDLVHVPAVIKISTHGKWCNK